jgi:hypothetical protein
MHVSPCAGTAGTAGTAGALQCAAVILRYFTRGTALDTLDYIH